MDEPTAWITTWNESNDAGVELHWEKKERGASSKHTPLYKTPQPYGTKQEPVAWLYKTNNTWEHVSFVEPPDDAYDEGSLRPVYTAPPNKEWVGLTDEEVGMLTVFDGLHHVEVPLLANFARAIEAKLKEKNA